MGKNSSKIAQDTAKTVKRKILKNNNFCLKAPPPTEAVSENIANMRPRRFELSFDPIRL